MNAKHLIAAAAVFAVAGSAFAVGSDDTAHYSLGKSSKTRAEVTAELRQAQADGTYIVGGQEFEGQIPASQTQYARTAPKGTETAQNAKAPGAAKAN